MKPEERTKPQGLDTELPAGAREPAESYAFVAAPAPVLDEVQMANCVDLMGPDWVARSLRQFAFDVEARLSALDAASPPDLARMAHGMISMAAHCGFTELLHVLENVQREARRGAGVSRIGELRAAGERALTAMRSYTPRA